MIEDLTVAPRESDAGRAGLSFRNIDRVSHTAYGHDHLQALRKLAVEVDGELRIRDAPPLLFSLHQLAPDAVGAVASGEGSVHAVFQPFGDADLVRRARPDRVRGGVDFQRELLAGVVGRPHGLDGSFHVVRARSDLLDATDIVFELQLPVTRATSVFSCTIRPNAS